MTNVVTATRLHFFLFEFFNPFGSPYDTNQPTELTVLPFGCFQYCGYRENLTSARWGYETEATNTENMGQSAGESARIRQAQRLRRQARIHHLSCGKGIHQEASK